MTPMLEARKVSRTSTVRNRALDLFGLEQSLHCGTELVDHLVDDRVVADLHALAVGDLDGRRRPAAR